MRPTDEQVKNLIVKSFKIELLLVKTRGFN